MQSDCPCVQWLLFNGQQQQLDLAIPLHSSPLSISTGNATKNHCSICIYHYYYCCCWCCSCSSCTSDAGGFSAQLPTCNFLTLGSANGHRPELVRICSLGACENFCFCFCFRFPRSLMLACWPICCWPRNTRPGKKGVFREMAKAMAKARGKLLIELSPQVGTLNGEGPQPLLALWPLALP